MSADKKTEVAEFLETLFKSNANKVHDCDSGVEDLFGEKSPFRVVCKCGSGNITIIGECGIQYSEETWYEPGSTILKCRDCGAALTVWHS